MTTTNEELAALPAGSEMAIDDAGRSVTVRHEEQGVWLIKRVYDGALQTTVWVRQIESGWRVSRDSIALGTYVADLPAAIRAGVARSREASKQP